MGWVCYACTFQNRNDTNSACEICDTKRSNAVVSGSSRKNGLAAAVAKSAPVVKATKQSTLFGGFVPEKSTQKAARKRKATEGGSDKVPQKQEQKQQQQQQQLLLVKSSSIRECSRDPLDELVKRTKKVMKETFKIRKLRNLQPAAVEFALRRQSQIVIMATGGGKSLCYQLPAVAMGGTTIVVSPLIALMNDQVHAMNTLGVPTAVVSSAQGEKNNLDVFERLLGRTLRVRKKTEVATLTPITLLYVTPEQIQSERMRNALKEMNQNNWLTGFAIDEAHCLSSWGHDFRPAYRKLGWLREAFPNVPCIACTATATDKVIKDIQETLRLSKCPCHMGTFDRENIYYQVRYKDFLNAGMAGGAMQDMVKFIKQFHATARSTDSPCSGIVYVHKREETESLAHLIRKETGLVAEGYHGGKKDQDRTRVQQDWISGKVQLAIATVAFGMGIDLAHVRYVIHWSMPKTVEGFYQESGRAGRDGLASSSIVYYSKSDVNKFEWLIKQRDGGAKKREGNNAANNEVLRALDALTKVVEYATTPICRRKYLLDFFGDKNSDPKLVCKNNCDFCKNTDKIKREIKAADTCESTTFHTKPNREKKEWDGQWDRPHGEENDFSKKSNPYTKSGDLKVTGESDWFDDEGGNSSTSKKKATVSSILSKFETVECKQSQRCGFVHFRAKADGEDVTKGNDKIRIPEHLVAAFKSPQQQIAKHVVAKPIETSGKIASEVDELKAELEKINVVREAKMRMMASNNVTPSATKQVPTFSSPPPPPAVTFKPRKKRK